MKKKLFGLGILLLGFIASGVPAYASSDFVYIPDDNIRSNILDYIGLKNNDYQLPTKSDMAKLSTDIINFNPERSLEGLQYATNVENIGIQSQQTILDFRPIGDLEKLKSYYAYNSLGDDMSRTLDIKPFSKLNSLESLYFGYANITDLTPLENLSNLKSFFSTGATITLPKEFISKENKTFIIESPVNYSSQFTNIAVQASSEEGDLNCELIDGAVIIKNLNVDTREIHLTMQGESDSFNWSEGFSSTMNFTVPVSWY